MAPKNVEANRPIGVDVGMVDPGCEGYLLFNHANQWFAIDPTVQHMLHEFNVKFCFMQSSDKEGIYLWGLERVVSGEVNCEEKHSTLVGTVWGPHDCGLRGWSIQNNSLVKKLKPASETDPLQQVPHYTGQVGPFPGPGLYYQGYIRVDRNRERIHNFSTNNYLQLLVNPLEGHFDCRLWLNFKREFWK